MPFQLSIDRRLPDITGFRTYAGWAECAAAGYRICGRAAVRFDIVERLTEALAKDDPPPDKALARLIGRPERELVGVLMALGYRRAEGGEAGAAGPWRLAALRRKRDRGPAPSGPFAVLAELAPAPGAKSGRARRP